MKNCRTSGFPLAVILLSVAASNAVADVQLDRVFGDHMVLQRDMAVPVWGTADPGEKVTVTFRDQQQSATADKDGKWMVKLQPLTVGEPAELAVAGKNSITCQDKRSSAKGRLFAGRKRHCQREPAQLRCWLMNSLTLIEHLSSRDQHVMSNEDRRTFRGKLRTGWTVIALGLAVNLLTGSPLVSAD